MPDAPAATQPIVVKVDANLKSLYHAALQALAAATAAGAVAWHKKYEIVANMINHSPPLYMAGSFATDDAFFAAILDESRQSVYRNLKVAKFSKSADLAKYTLTKLGLAIAYLEARNKTPLAHRADVDFDKLKIQFKRGDKTVTKSLLDITRLELTEAIGQLTARPKPKQSPIAKAAIAAAKDVKGVEATVTKTQLVVRVSFDSIAELGKALAAFKPPTS